MSIRVRIRLRCVGTLAFVAIFAMLVEGQSARAADECYTAAPLRDQDGKELAIEPVCQVLARNLNEFCEEPPMVCGIRIAPQFVSDLSLPTWVPVETYGRLDVVESTLRAQLQKFNPAAIDKIWAEEFPTYEGALANERLSVSTAELDLYQTGRRLKVFRIDPGSCPQDNFYILKDRRRWNERLSDPRVRVLPAPDAVAELFRTYTSLDPWEPYGDALIFRGRVYTYHMTGNREPAELDNAVHVDMGANTRTATGSRITFRNVCDIKYRSNRGEER